MQDIGVRSAMNAGENSRRVDPPIPPIATAQPTHNGGRGPERKLRFPCFFDPHKRTPVMMETANRVASPGLKPLEGITAVVVIHLEDNALAFAAMLIMLGLDPRRATFFAKGAGYRYANKRLVVAALRRWGFSVRQAHEIDRQFFDRTCKAIRDKNEQLLVIEDGPFWGQFLLDAPETWPLIRGYLQQTTRGMTPFLKPNVRPAFPILSLPESDLKKLKEPPFVGKTFIRALTTLFPHREWTNAKIAAFGSGAIGRAVGDAAAALCMRVAFYDASDRSKFLADNICGEVCSSPIEAVRGASVIAGFSGGADGPSITAEVLAAAEHGSIIVSNSSEQFEIDLGYLKSAGVAKPYYIEGVQRSAKTRIGTIHRVGPRAKELVLVNDGWPMSFIGLPGTTLPDQIADFVMALMLVGAIELSAGRFDGECGISAGAIDKLADEYELPAAYLRHWRS